MSQCPDIVDECLLCGKNTVYDGVHLLVALDLKNVDTDATRGQMTAVIRYKISYTVAGKGPFMLSFALGNDVSLRRVLRLPTLLAMGADINLVKGLLSCLGLNRSLPLNCNLRVKVHPRVLLLIITRPLFPQEFPLT